MATRTLVDVIDSFDDRRGTALIYKNGFRTFRYSYPELASLVRKCATFYAERGIKAGDKVAVWGPNRPEWVIAYLGAVYCGAVVVPLDIQMLPEQAAKILKHSEAKLLVGSASRTRFVTDTPTASLEDLEFDLKGQQAAAHKAAPDDVVEIIYTSGTTGDPKGVLLTHRNIVSNVDAIVSHLRVGERDCMLSLLPLSHMFGQNCGMLAPLSAGLSVIFIAAMTARSMFEALAQERVTIILGVPRILQGIRSGMEAKLIGSVAGRLLTALAARINDAPRAVKKTLLYPIHAPFGRSFRFFVSGGAALDAASAEFFNRFGFTVLQGYGLTECSPILTAQHEEEAGGIDAGVAIPHVEIRLSQDGEVLARGENIFGGYFKNDAQTAEAFRDGWFLTGDLGELDATGRLFIRGRKKETVVTPAGVNVYPDDIEPVVNAVAGVKESCIVGVPCEGGEEVHAVIIPEEENADLMQVIRAANEHLNTSQRIRSASLWSEPEFPKTSTMKIKRGQVRQRVTMRASDTAAGALPPSKLRSLIAQATRAPLEHITDTATLYGDLKLDSIGRIELASLITQEYFFDFSEDSITETTTVRDLEGIVAARSTGASRFSYPRWPHRKYMVIARFLGGFINDIAISRFFTRLTTGGKENLAHVRGPVIFAANHVSYGDRGIIVRALPFRYRYMIAAPAFAEFFFMPKDTPLIKRIWKKFSYFFGAATMALFPTSQEGSSMRALQHAGSIIDQGESILIFPEAERTRTSEMLPFTKGTAILAKNLRVPIVPIGHRGLEYVYPRGAAIPKFGRVTVNIGKPILFEKESPDDITERLREEIEKLRKA
jgi:long-chain acyl-CoA synthetase